jgi:hypothetical protein
VDNAPTAVDGRARDVGLWTVLGGLVAAIVLLSVGVRSWSVWGGIVIAPIFVLLSIPALRREAEREGDADLFALLVVALGVKLGGSIARYVVAFSVYGGVADAAAYHRWGVKLAEEFRHGRFDTGLHDLSGTEFIRFLTGLVYTVIGPSRLGGFLFFSWLGFVGLFLFYRAFVVAVPEGRRRAYAVLVFFLPSLVYWPSSIGKEAWMMLALGLCAFGAAKLLGGLIRSGIIPLAVGLWFAWLVRPHVAGLVAIALGGAFLLKKASKQTRLLAPLGKAIAFAGLIAIAVVLVAQTDRFLKRSGYRPDRGITAVLSAVQERTEQGGSSFAPSILESPERAPIAAVTVLFRPLVVDAHNVQALVAGVEGTFLLLLCVVRYRWILAAVGSIRRQPYAGFAIAYTALFVVAFSSVANFGLLARERAQLLPLFLVLLTIPPPDVRDAEPIVR